MKKTLVFLAILATLITLGALAMAGPPPYERAVDDAVGNCVAITASSVQYTLPTAYRGGWFYIVAVGGDAYLLGGTNPTVNNAVGYFSMMAPDGSPLLVRLSSAKIAVKGSSAAGFICFIPQKLS